VARLGLTAWQGSGLPRSTSTRLTNVSVCCGCCCCCGGGGGCCRVCAVPAGGRGREWRRPLPGVVRRWPGAGGELGATQHRRSVDHHRRWPEGRGGVPTAFGRSPCHAAAPAISGGCRAQRRSAVAARCCSVGAGEEEARAGGAYLTGAALGSVQRRRWRAVTEPAATVHVGVGRRGVECVGGAAALPRGSGWAGAAATATATAADAESLAWHRWRNWGGGAAQPRGHHGGWLRRGAGRAGGRCAAGRGIQPLFPGQQLRVPAGDARGGRPQLRRRRAAACGNSCGNSCATGAPPLLAGGRARNVCLEPAAASDSLPAG
jgi:hypothetical protein